MKQENQVAPYRGATRQRFSLTRCIDVVPLLAGHTQVVCHAMTTRFACSGHRFGRECYPLRATMNRGHVGSRRLEHMRLRPDAKATATARTPLTVRHRSDLPPEQGRDGLAHLAHVARRTGDRDGPRGGQRQPFFTRSALYKTQKVRYTYFLLTKRWNHTMATRTRYNFLIGTKTLASLQTLAKRDDTSVSELIRHAIKQTYGRISPDNRPALPGPEPGQQQSG